MIYRSLGLGLLLLSMAFHTLAQSTVDPDFDPSYGPEVMSVEAWAELDAQDYVVHKVESLDNIAELSTLSTDENSCAGFTTVAPTYRIDWVRETIDEDLSMRFFFMNDLNTTLAIHEPDGDWLCADDWETTEHPLIDIEELRTGSYAVWVGNTTEEDFTGRLIATIGDYDPSNPPIEPLRFTSVFQGAGINEARVLYIEIDENMDDNMLDISVDVALKGARGNEFRVTVYLYDAETDRPLKAFEGSPQNEAGLLADIIEMRLRAAEEFYDYGKNSKGGLEFSFPLDELADTSAVYPVIRIEMRENPDSPWQDVTTYKAENRVYKP